MSTNFVQPGNYMNLTVPTGGATKGDVYVIRSGTSGRCGIWRSTLSAGATGVLALGGVFALPKAASGALTNGALVYWNDSTNLVTTTATGNTLLGTAFGAAASADTTVNILLNDKPGEE